jgi:hypothetical protein
MMERLFEGLATRTIGVFCKKLDLILSMVRGENNMSS